MKINRLRVIPVIALAALAGCSHVPSKQQIGTATGAVVGGAAGAVLTGTTTGTVVGAGAGAVIGSEIGKSLEKKR
ncbi:MAG: glycine zipper 2TM domain-containing protein [Burkholderiales bacterium]|nr:glycine zipper 2TM domain-containing protein [Burkholderiales bacterium]